MATREEIREGIKTILSCSDHYEKLTEEILKFEDSKGVVLKVERELPTRFLYTGRSLQDTYGVSQADMLRAGYVAVEPLIEEENENDRDS